MLQLIFYCLTCLPFAAAFFQPLSFHSKLCLCTRAAERKNSENIYFEAMIMHLHIFNRSGCVGRAKVMLKDNRKQLFSGETLARLCDLYKFMSHPPGFEIVRLFPFSFVHPVEMAGYIYHPRFQAPILSHNCLNLLLFTHKNQHFTDMWKSRPLLLHSLLHTELTHNLK